ncbi:hypothetical protein B0H34DRAFT_680317 [Crassisporium funariophilum]|nr:hypothetical protein B0H34DRAFT_680317 [Crassisporium funariophilum]
MSALPDALRYSGFQGCASSREYYWHLGADRQDRWDRFPAVTGWEWVPGEGCNDFRHDVGAEEMVKELVEQGGWYLVGDSVTENHFFSLSCLLYPHVIGSPNFTELGYYEHDWPQYLYLDPSSSLITSNSVKLPQDFNMTSTPLVTFRRVDILFSKPELVSIHQSLQSHSIDSNSSSQGVKDDNQSLFSDSLVFSLPLSEYLSQFLSPLPEGGYSTMIVGTGGHWTTMLFPGTSPPGIDGILLLFEAAMKEWVAVVQKALAAANWRDQQHQGLAQRPGNDKIRGRRQRYAVMRAYPPGHENCNDARAPWTEIQPFIEKPWNWEDLWRFNAILDKILPTESREDHQFVHYLPIDRPARLRPDAHVTSDCLHIMSGAGVLEGWSRYIWHFINNEVT